MLTALFVASWCLSRWCLTHCYPPRTAVVRAFSERAVKEQPRPVEKRPQAEADAADDTVVYAEAEDPDDGNESWLDIVKDLHINPSEETVAKSEKEAASAPDKKPSKKKNTKKGGGKKKKR